jgi:signal transduction histidine kinase
MRVLLVICFLMIGRLCLMAQQSNIAALREKYRLATTDSARQDACFDLANYYNEVNRDSALFFIEERLAIARRSGYKILEASVLNTKAYQKIQVGKYADALKCIMESLSITSNNSLQEINKWRVSQFPIKGKERLLTISASMHQFGLLMRETENLNKEIEYFKKALALAQQIGHIDRQMISNMNTGSAYFRKRMLDSALFYALQSDSLTSLPDYRGQFKGRNLSNMGDVYFKKGEFDRAKALYLSGLNISLKQNNQFNVAVTKHKLAQLYLKINQFDSALYHAKDNLVLLQLLNNGANFQLNLGSVYEDIYLAHKGLQQKDSAYKYLGLTFQMKDSLYKIRIANLSAFQNVSFEETLRLENLEKAQIQTEAKIRLYSVLAGLIVVSFVGIILYRNNLQRKKSNNLLQAQKDEIALQKMHVEEAMEQLKATQSQLVQSEKMASLGELTAGIAHEIQNPLNFVNNFSEVSGELIDEMNGALEKGDLEDAKAIASDIQQNLSKIAHHGKRADSIVKGMLQHSRSSTGQKELTDINALCDEYLRLSYHGLRAKDSSFNAGFETHFDGSIGSVNIVPQEIGRVLLNLLNNAFYAVNEKAHKGIEGYAPKVVVRTEKLGNNIKIVVEDNGMGIPERIKEKIFQPFFTTKPTGQGTGLGLSLSYDIVKAHGGDLKVDSKAGEGTIFYIVL